jgi:predicted RNA-binding Zn ribbon-like protein
MMGEHDDGEFLFEANDLALDLVNTERMRDDERADLLTDVAALGRWLSAARLPSEAADDEALAEARRLRGAVRDAAGALADGQPVPGAALDTLNGLLRRRTGYEQVEPADGDRRYARRFVDTSPAAVRLLAPVADAAARLLTEADPARVRRCENPRCIRFYYDTSKNHTRRWCSMAACGNRAKAAAHYARVRAEKAEKSARG